MSDPGTLLRDGDLAGLRALFAARIRADAARATHRFDLADVLIVQGELDRADTQLDLAAAQDPAVALPVALTRQLIRAAIARDECFASRRPPELVTEPDDAVTAALAMLAGAAMPASERELAGTIDGRAFIGLRDGDDRTAQILEVLTSTGKYVWVSLAQIVSLKPQRPGRLRDLVWRQAELEVRGGPSGIVYLPAVYPAATTDAQRLGRETDWVEHGAVTAGVGLRTFLIGDDAVTFDDFAELTVDA